MISHSGWFQHWAAELVARGISLLAPDRRGSGLDGEARGDAGSVHTLLDDLDRWAELADRHAGRLHLCGFCWGANYAIHYLSRCRRRFASLLLVAPGIYPTAQVLARPQEAGESREPTVEVPFRLEEFTRGPDLGRALRADPCRLERVSPRFVAIERQMAAWLPIHLIKAKLPIFFVLAERDEISDSRQTRELYDRHRGPPDRCVTLPSAHAVVLEAPLELAELCASWVAECR